jgi:hypothetical protein
VKYLNQLGIGTKGIVVQRGKHNYAGPNCPGARWTCTTAKRVVQINLSSDSQFQCTPSTGGTQSAPGECTIVQVSMTGTNHARCYERTGSPAAEQSCVITQQNVSGDNLAEVHQRVDANNGAVQDATQYASVTQQNGSGSNAASVVQDVDQSTKDTSTGGAQKQDAHQDARVDQTSGTGDNVARVDQSQHQRAKAEKDTATQAQNAEDAGQNIYAGIEQTSTSGRNVTRLDQSTDQEADAKKAGTAQQQGSPSGGIHGHFDQLSSGLSSIDGQQREQQVLKAHGKKTTSGSQTQYGPQFFGSQQRGNPANHYDIDQRSDQRASDVAFQDNRQYANCDTDGICTADQRMTQNGEEYENSCTDSSCHIGQTATSTSEGSSADTCSGVPQNEGPNPCPIPPPPPGSEPPGCEFCEVLTVGSVSRTS